MFELLKFLQANEGAWIYDLAVAFRFRIRYRASKPSKRPMKMDFHREPRYDDHRDSGRIRNGRLLIRDQLAKKMVVKYAGHSEDRE